VGANHLGLTDWGKHYKLSRMWNDVIDLREFYAHRLGRNAQRMIRHELRQMWPDVKGLRVLGIGFPTPYLGMFREEAERVIASMPAGQGVMHWPIGERGLTMLNDDADLPLPDLSVDRVVLVHALECSEQVRHMLREVWRVMAGSGRMIVIAPNRRGLWARADSTPMGHGRPYSRGQLSQLLKDNMFMPGDVSRALFVPPINLRVVQGPAAAWEKMGNRLFPAAAGVIMTEATKQMYAATVAAESRQKRSIQTAPKRSESLNRVPRTHR
jgi:SAM-dependent methyltransferase